MNLQQKLAARDLVIRYLEACKQQAETDMGADGLSDAAWNNAARVYARCNADLISAKRGDGWKAFHADALHAQQMYGI